MRGAAAAAGGTAAYRPPYPHCNMGTVCAAHALARLPGRGTIDPLSFNPAACATSCCRPPPRAGHPVCFGNPLDSTEHRMR
jgi:hypothetical protein